MPGSYLTPPLFSMTMVPKIAKSHLVMSFIEMGPISQAGHDAFEYSKVKM